MPDALWSGRCVRTFNAYDDLHRESLRIDLASAFYGVG
jgi:hypothetical protein